MERTNIVPPVSHFPQLARNQAAVLANEPVAVAPRNRNLRINPINPPQEVKREELREELRVVLPPKRNPLDELVEIYGGQRVVNRRGQEGIVFQVHELDYILTFLTPEQLFRMGNLLQEMGQAIYVDRPINPLDGQGAGQLQRRVEQMPARYFFDQVKKIQEDQNQLQILQQREITEAARLELARDFLRAINHAAGELRLRNQHLLVLRNNMNPNIWNIGAQQYVPRAFQGEPVPNRGRGNGQRGPLALELNRHPVVAFIQQPQDPVGQQHQPKPSWIVPAVIGSGVVLAGALGWGLATMLTGGRGHFPPIDPKLKPTSNPDDGGLSGAETAVLSDHQGQGSSEGVDLAVVTQQLLQILYWLSTKQFVWVGALLFAIWKSKGLLKKYFIFLGIFYFFNLFTKALLAGVGSFIGNLGGSAGVAKLPTATRQALFKEVSQLTTVEAYAIVLAAAVFTILVSQLTNFHNKFVIQRFYINSGSGSGKKES